MNFIDSLRKVNICAQLFSANPAELITVVTVDKPR